MPGPSTFTQRRFTASSRDRRPYATFLFLSAAQAKNRAIDPAVLEVNGLGEFGCKVEPVTAGRKVIAVRLSWWAKNLDERKSALNELRFSRVGRRARLQGKVETVAPLAMLPAPPSQHVTVAADPIPRRDRSGRERSAPSEGQSGLTEKEMQRFRRDFGGLDVPWLEREFRVWVAEREPPENYAAAFYGFMKQKQRQQRS